MIDFTSEKQNYFQTKRIEIAIPPEKVSNKDLNHFELNLIKCSLCKNIPSLPIKEVINCDRFFCYNCVEKHNKKSNQKTCPVCGKISIFKPPSQCDMLIFSKLKLKCKNKSCDREFNYINELNDLVEHEEKCEFGSLQTSIFEKPQLSYDYIFDNCYSIGSNSFCFECGMISKGRNHSCIKYLCAKIINYEKFLNEEIEKIKESLIFLQKEKTTHKLLTKEDFINKFDQISDKENNETKFQLNLNTILSEKKQNTFLSQKSKKSRVKDFHENSISEFTEDKRLKKKNDSVFTLKAGNTPQKNNKKTKISVIITTSIFKKIENLVLPNVKNCSNMSLIFKASEHKFCSESFHTACDGIFPTIVLIKDTEGNIFGGYNVIPWKSKNYGTNQYDRRRQNFLFSIDKNRIYPVKTPTYSVDFDKNLGPCFGEDLKILDRCDVKENSSFLGKFYKNYIENEVNSLSTQNIFLVAEYEVFHLY